MDWIDLVKYIKIGFIHSLKLWRSWVVESVFSSGSEQATRELSTKYGRFACGFVMIFV